MGKFKTLLVAIVLALPFTALNAANPVEAIDAAEGAVVPVAVEMAGTSTECCWVYYMGRWWCIAACM